MKESFLIVCVIVLAFASGCANHIKQANTVIWDRVPSSERVSLDDQRIEGAIVKAKVRFICQKRQFAVTNDYVTPYVVACELYEVPVGVPGTVVGFVWYLLSELVTGFAVDDDVSTGLLDWGAAGLNPFLNVENGMWAAFAGERYEIREKRGSRRPQEGSTPEPYDAVLPPDGGKVMVNFAGGEPVEAIVGEEVLLMVNLIEIARVMPRPDSQKIVIKLGLRWNPKLDPVEKTVTVFIDKPLAEKLHALSGASNTLMATTDPEAFRQALKAVEDAGFTREAAMVRDKRQAVLKGPK